MFGELVEYSRDFLSAAVWARFVRLKRIVESENRFGYDRAGRIGCAGLVFYVRLHTKHFSREAGLLLFEIDYTVYFR